MLQTSIGYSRLAFLAAAALTAGLASSVSAQYLMLVESTGDKGALLNRTDGSLVNLNFILEDNALYPMTTPKAAIQVDNEIWVSDQVNDVIYRFTASLTPTFIGAINTGLDNIRGIRYVNGVVYVCNSGTANGAPGNAIIRYTPQGTLIDSFTSNISPFDVVAFNGNIVVGDSNVDDLTQYTFAGTFVNTVHNGNVTTGVHFPQQIHVFPTGPNNADEFWVAGFSPPFGIYRISASGAIVNRYITPSAPRGLYPLDNGNWVYTDGVSMRSVNLANPSDATIVISGISGQYISPLDLSTCPVCPADYNQDGGVTGDDIAVFFADFEAGSSCADTNIDGGITGDDVATFFIAFEAGGC